MRLGNREGPHRRQGTGRTAPGSRAASRLVERGFVELLKREDPTGDDDALARVAVSILSVGCMIGDNILADPDLATTLRETGLTLASVYSQIPGPSLLDRPWRDGWMCCKIETVADIERWDAP